MHTFTHRRRCQPFRATATTTTTTTTTAAKITDQQLREKTRRRTEVGWTGSGVDMAAGLGDHQEMGWFLGATAKAWLLGLVAGQQSTN